MSTIGTECDHREVNFYKYCPLCKYSELNSTDEPCDECLGYPENMYSEKPVKYEEK